ncbi:multicopper oxidase domain-containing protein [Viridibacillus arvi]|uniref:multicopper oxidase domain-containing protein n=1 Tax=Viridibacillus arvi TaxID=263475 RepID=UPI003D2A9FCB
MARTPFPSEVPVDENTATVMQFRVALPLSNIDTNVIPANKVPLPKINEQAASKKRFLFFIKDLDKFGRPYMKLDNKQWDAPITENPKLGSTEIWHLINVSPDSHPIHLHLIDFQIIDRRDIDSEKFNKEGIIQYTGKAISPEPQEQGWEDTVRANPTK